MTASDWATTRALDLARLLVGEATGDLPADAAVRAIAAELRAARAEERERCAAVAESVAHELSVARESVQEPWPFVFRYRIAERERTAREIARKIKEEEEA